MDTELHDYESYSRDNREYPTRSQGRPGTCATGVPHPPSESTWQSYGLRATGHDSEGHAWVGFGAVVYRTNGLLGRGELSGVLFDVLLLLPLSALRLSCYFAHFPVVPNSNARALLTRHSTTPHPNQKPATRGRTGTSNPMRFYF